MDVFYIIKVHIFQEREAAIRRMEENLDQRELQLEEKRMILEIAIRVNDLRSLLYFAFLSSKLTEDVTDLSVSVTSLRCCLWTTAT